MRAPLSRRAAWWRMVIALVVTVAVSLGIGFYAKYKAEPRLLGTSPLGSWAYPGGPQIGIRIDAVTLSDSLPSAYTDAPDVTTQPGMKLAAVTFSVALDNPDWDTLNCWIKLYNVNGDEYTNSVSGVAGPENTQCYDPDLAESRPAGPVDPFQGQIVLAVPDVAVSELEVRVSTMTNDRDYWRFPAS